MAAADGFDLGQGGVVLLEEHVVQIGQLAAASTMSWIGSTPVPISVKQRVSLRSSKTAMSMFSVGETIPW